MTGSPGDADLLAVLVHEVRSPVAALAALREAFVRDGLEPGERRRLAELAVDACRIIERLLTDHAVTSVRPEAVDAARLVRDAVTAASIGGARVRAIVQSGLPALHADSLRLRQALDNLIANALVHGGHEVDVVVSAVADGGDLVISVEDSGPGILEADQARIFDAGVRLATGAAGTGLGLALTRTIVEAHGGTVEVRSRPGHGATFTVRLAFA